MSRPEIVDDVMAERRAAGITVAPEAALHRALQARTDELERVRAELAGYVTARGEKMTQAEMRANGAECRVRELAAEVATITRERDEARTEIAAALREIPIEQHRFSPGKPPVVLRDEVAHVVREWARRNHEFDRVWDACETVLTADEARAVEWTDEQGVEVLVLAALAKVARERDEFRDEVSRLNDDANSSAGTSLRWLRERDEARASITRFAEAASAHDNNADAFVGDEYHISTRALVEEFCREHGHPRLSGLVAPRPLATWWPASDTRTRTR
jgi:hypothetical protein